MDGILDQENIRGGGPKDDGGNSMFVDDSIAYGTGFAAYLKH